MEPLFQKIDIESGRMFIIKDNRLPRFDCLLHFHPEYELICIWKGKGQCLIGDKILDYNGGELLLLGPNLPHAWISSRESTSYSRSIVIQLNSKVWNDFLLESLELQPVFQMLKRAERGIIFHKTVVKLSISRMLNMLKSEGLEGFIQLLTLLNDLSVSENYEIIASPTYSTPANLKDCQRVNKVFDFVINHYQEVIHIAKVATEINMSESAFCRYFKKMTKKTFVQYLNEFRIGEACRLLSGSELNISQIGIESGFESISNFNKVFKNITGMSPRVYRTKVTERPLHQ